MKIIAEACHCYWNLSYIPNVNRSSFCFGVCIHNFSFYFTFSSLCFFFGHPVHKYISNVYSLLSKLLPEAWACELLWGWPLVLATLGWVVLVSEGWGDSPLCSIQLPLGTAHGQSSLIKEKAYILYRKLLVSKSMMNKILKTGYVYIV